MSFSSLFISSTKFHAFYLLPDTSCNYLFLIIKFAIFHPKGFPTRRITAVRWCCRTPFVQLIINEMFECPFA